MPMDNAARPLRAAIRASKAKCMAGSSSNGGMHIRVYPGEMLDGLVSLAGFTIIESATSRGATKTAGEEVELTRIVVATNGESEGQVDRVNTGSDNEVLHVPKGSDPRTAVQKALDSLPGAQAKKEVVPLAKIEPTLNPTMSTTMPPTPQGQPVGKRKTLAAVMIVKNEEACLKRCLDSIKDHVDEIVIVDTGSTDKTVEIARKYTDRIWEYPWNDDFSAARNFSLEQATACLLYTSDAADE